jgi:RNA polymerase sigma factor (sigma-70 family)
VGTDAIPPRAGGLPARLVLGPALRAQSDGRLVRLVREGYEGAFEEIVRRYRRPLGRFADSISRGRGEDVTQDSFRKALEALRGGDAEIELRPWLYRIVRNTALNDLRDRPPAAAELAEDLVAGTRSAAAEAEERAEVAELIDRLRALPENQRAALLMRELDGMGHEEIAAALGISKGAARQAIARGRAAVRSGFGALLPLPWLRSLLDGVAPIEAGAGTGALAGAGASAIGAGGAGALKIGLATIVVTGSLAGGVALDHHGGSGHGPHSHPGPVAERVGDDDAPSHGRSTETEDSSPSSNSSEAIEIADHPRGRHHDDGRAPRASDDDHGRGHSHGRGRGRHGGRDHDQGDDDRSRGREGGDRHDATMSIAETSSSTGRGEDYDAVDLSHGDRGGSALGGGSGPGHGDRGGRGPGGGSGSSSGGPGRGGKDSGGSDDRSGRGGGSRSGDGSGSSNGGSRSGDGSGSSGGSSGSSRGGHGSDNHGATSVTIESPSTPTVEASSSGGAGKSSSGGPGPSSGSSGPDDSLAATTPDESSGSSSTAVEVLAPVEDSSISGGHGSSGGPGPSGDSEIDP